MVRKGLPKSIIKKYGISKKAWAVYRGRSKSKSSVSRRKTKTTKTKTRSVRRMARKKRRRRSGKSWTSTVFKMIRIGALVAPGAAAVLNAHEQGWGPEGMADQFCSTYTGYSFVHKKFEWGWLARGWTPYIVANLMTHGIPKLVGLIRRL